MFTNIQELDEALSRPSPADSDVLSRLEGDLLILGAGGKMGPSLALRARRAIDQSGLRKRVIAVSRFNESGLRETLLEAGIEVVPTDLLDSAAVAQLPDAANIVFMAGRKFGTQGAAHLTWAMNVILPSRAAERYQNSRIVAFSSGSVYPFCPVAGGGAVEQTPPDPAGEYAQSVLGRERVFEYFSERFGVRILLLRLNYAVEMRYGVLVDVGRKVHEGHPIDLTMGHVNVIWQGDANSIALRSFGLCASPPDVLNVTGPEILSVREIANHFGRLFRVEPSFQGTEAGTALLSNAKRCRKLFGPPSVSAKDLIEWTARWIAAGGATLGKPTHFEARDGRY